METLLLVGVWVLGLLGLLAACAGLDCLWDGWRDMRRGERAFDRQTGLYVLLTGLGLCLLGGLLMWGFYSWR